MQQLSRATARLINIPKAAVSYITDQGGRGKKIATDKCRCLQGLNGGPL